MKLPQTRLELLALAWDQVKEGMECIKIELVFDFLDSIHHQYCLLGAFYREMKLPQTRLELVALAWDQVKEGMECIKIEFSLRLP
jgi:NifU-like protein involved in Fe-S cluster formation